MRRLRLVKCLLQGLETGVARAGDKIIRPDGFKMDLSTGEASEAFTVIEQNK